MPRCAKFPALEIPFWPSWMKRRGTRDPTGRLARGQETISGIAQRPTAFWLFLNGSARIAEGKCSPSADRVVLFIGSERCRSLRYAAFSLEHDPEKWVPVFREDHAQAKR